MNNLYLQSIEIATPFPSTPPSHKRVRNDGHIIPRINIFKNVAIKLTVSNVALQGSTIFVAAGKPTQEAPPGVLWSWLLRALAYSKLNSENGFPLMPLAP